ncbi:MAG: double-strand break repair helicase AddA [Sphingomonadales bacterium]|nr:double-strand break repair helicase AddA [Sphingomonadales bacterium]
MSVPDQASLAQRRAAEPAASTWLSANAGSGKTKVLTDRVARLLLGGTEPQKVLCLTYTKAAAAEMQNRLLARLGQWAMLPDAELRGQLAALGEEGAIDAERLAQARRLFAKAIETPGGLKIQTIHSFCASLLRRFPLEAGVSHGFSEMDDRAGDLLRSDILEEMAAGPDRPVFDALAMAFPAADLEGLVKEISHNRDGFRVEATPEMARGLYGLPQDLHLEDLIAQALRPSDFTMIRELLPLLAASSINDQKLGAKLALVDGPTPRGLERLEDALMYAKKEQGPKLGKLITKALTNGPAAHLVDALDDLAERVAEARAKRLALIAAERLVILNRFARAFLAHLDRRKAARGWLDFDDLIERAGALLSDPSVAQWVLFRLDGGIDHILVDEAQDTSPGQWAVIERLADEFTAGEGARGEPRTIFVVGDRKQSIYSFQGADLQRFEAMQSHFSAKFEGVGRPLQEMLLRHSFRSSHAVLRLVDLTFSGAAAKGLGGVPEHIAFKAALPGRVDLWPPVAKPEKPEEHPWESPVDLIGAQDAPVVLARAIAAEIRAMIEAGVQLPEGEGARPVTEGDFLILVQRRGPLFAEIIRACKAEGLAIAGADRLKLGAELAVRDIGSVLAFLATPEDDLALAEALKSPLFGWSEAELYRLAQPRRGYLWEALRNSDLRPETLAMLQDLRDQADFLRPFELIERLLTRHGGRERLVARLGPEAEDGIDELIAQALAFERAEVPSLTGFLGWLSADDVEVKRQLGSGGGAIRVMTVHGSKGLEAPIVILPDTASSGSPPRGEIFRLAGGEAAWRVSPDDMPPELRAAYDAEIARTAEEKMRLLYVAMTRAEKWLIVAAAGDVGDGEKSWYALMRQGLEKAGIEAAQGLSPQVQALGEIARHSHAEWPAPAAARVRTDLALADLPDWARLPAPRPEKPAQALSPSDLGGAKALPGEAALLDEEAAKRRGRAIHLLLEHLPGVPPEHWPELAAELLPEPDSAETETYLDEATRVLSAPAMQPFLVPEALAEVEITAALPELGGRRIHGIIDRLVITAETVEVLDYKSNAVVPADVEQVPLGIVRQMAAYRAALMQIYPGRAIRCTVLWTATGGAMVLPDAQLDAAIRSATLS